MTEYERLSLQLLSDITARLAQLDAFSGQAPWATSGWAEEALRVQKDSTDAVKSVAALLACSRAPAM